MQVTSLPECGLYGDVRAGGVERTSRSGLRGFVRDAIGVRRHTEPRRCCDDEHVSMLKVMEKERVRQAVTGTQGSVSSARPCEPIDVRSPAHRHEPRASRSFVPPPFAAHMNPLAATLLGYCFERFFHAGLRCTAVLVALCVSLSCALAVEPAERPLPEQRITTKVTAELFAISGNESIHVHIETVRGAVTLTGEVLSQNIVQQFTRAAKRPVGVESVDASGLTVAAR